MFGRCQGLFSCYSIFNIYSITYHGKFQLDKHKTEQPEIARFILFLFENEEFTDNVICDNDNYACHDF